MDSYAISVLPADRTIRLDSLPVAKISHYPLEKHDNKPYAQAAFAMTSKQLALRLLSFETDPLPESKIGAVLYLFPENPAAYLEVWAWPSAVEITLFDGKMYSRLAGTQISHAGEDLQGVFWGYDLLVDARQLGDLRLAAPQDQTIRGNFFKVQDVAPTHYGALGLAAFQQTDQMELQNMVTMPIINY